MIEILATDNKEKFKSDLENLLNQGYQLLFSNMSMMDAQISHRPAFYALLKR